MFHIYIYIYIYRYIVSHEYSIYIERERDILCLISCNS